MKEGNDYIAIQFISCLTRFLAATYESVYISLSIRKGEKKCLN